MNKRKYKIGILVDQLILGGVQKIAIEDARNFEKLGHEATLLVLMRKGANKNYKSYTKGVNVKFLSDSYPWPFLKSIKFPIFSFFSTLHILSPILAPFVIKKKRFDIIVSHGTTTCFTAQGLKFFNNIPYIAFIHDPMNYILKTAYSNSPLRKLFPFMKPILKYLEKKLIEQSEKVILDSKLHQKFISTTYKIKSIVLPAGTDIPKQIRSNNKNYILAATRWEKNKNPELLVKLAKDIPDLVIKIAGSWTSAKQYHEFAKSITDNGLKEKISLYPEISENELKKLYQNARIYVHPIKEAFGLGGLEASANGCPIVIPAGSGITNYLKNNEDGIFVQNQNYENFLETVKKLWSNPQLAQKMGTSAHQKVKALSWENHTRKLLEIVNNCLPAANTTIVALETGHASESYLSGGDKLLEKMAKYLPSNVSIKVIIPKIGIKHWHEANLKNVELIELSPSIFDNNNHPILIFVAYLIRIFQSYFKLNKLKNAQIIYSSTNVFPDVVPVFLFNLFKTRVPWISRIHHLIPPPNKRPGLIFVNIASFVLQALSSKMIAKRSTSIIALNKTLKETLIKKGFPQNKLQILGAGIEFEKISASKSKYCPVAANSSLKMIMREKGRFASVGLPCHIHGLRKAERVSRALSGKIVLHIGLLCSHITSFQGVEFLLGKLGIRLKDVTEISFRGKGWPGSMMIQVRDGSVTEIPLFGHWKAYWPIFSSFFFTPIRCTLCPDQAAELADISLGDAWLPELKDEKIGESIIIARTKKGDEILQLANSAKSVSVRPVSVRKLEQSQAVNLTFKKKDLANRKFLLQSFGKATPMFNLEFSSPRSAASFLRSVFVYCGIKTSDNRPIRKILRYVPFALFRVYYGIYKFISYI